MCVYIYITWGPHGGSKNGSSGTTRGHPPPPRPPRRNLEVHRILISDSFLHCQTIWIWQIPEGGGGGCPVGSRRPRRPESDPNPRRERLRECRVSGEPEGFGLRVASGSCFDWVSQPSGSGARQPESRVRPLLPAFITRPALSTLCAMPCLAVPCCAALCCAVLRKLGPGSLLRRCLSIDTNTRPTTAVALEARRSKKPPPPESR